jgi:hypothetical protein
MPSSDKIRALRAALQAREAALRRQQRAITKQLQWAQRHEARQQQHKIGQAVTEIWGLVDGQAVSEFCKAYSGAWEQFYDHYRRAQDQAPLPEMFPDAEEISSSPDADAATNL